MLIDNAAYSSCIFSNNRNEFTRSSFNHSLGLCWVFIVLAVTRPVKSVVSNEPSISSARHSGHKPASKDIIRVWLYDCRLELTSYGLSVRIFLISFRITIDSFKKKKFSSIKLIPNFSRPNLSWIVFFAIITVSGPHCVNRSSIQQFIYFLQRQQQ